MAFRHESAANRSEMNIVPLIDVLLVLLVIFMVAAPVATREIRIGLQGGPPPPRPELQPDPLLLRIDASGGIRLDAQALDRPALSALLRMEAAREPQPSLQVDADAEADYQAFADVLAIARNAGLRNIGFVASR